MTNANTEGASTGALWSWVAGVTASSSPVLSVAGKELVEGRCLGDGGFAYVYEARDRSSGEVFALRKALCQDSERLAAAEAEIALLRTLLAHANIVRFYGAEFLKESSGITQAVSLFEFCGGGTLLSRLQVGMTAAVESGRIDAAARCCPGCLPEADVLSVLEGVGCALAHLHTQVTPVVHYDVKSENILLGSNSLWKLCDFGSASTQTFELAGATRRVLLEAEEFIHGRITAIYRSPEVADVYLRWAIGPKVDIFALGCVLFATLTGVHPFPLDSSLANIQANYKLPPEAANLYSAALPIWLHRLLAREPHARVSAHDLCAEIRRFREFREEPPALVTSAPSSAKPGLASAHNKDTPTKESPPEATTASFNPWSGPAIAPDASWQAAPWTGPPVMPDAPWQAFAEEESTKDQKDQEDKKGSPDPASPNGMKTAAEEADERDVEVEQSHTTENLKPQPETHGSAIANNVATATSNDDLHREDVTAERRHSWQMEDARNLRQDVGSSETQQLQIEAIAPPAGGLQATAKATPVKLTPAAAPQATTKATPVKLTPVAKRAEAPVVGAPKSALSASKVDAKRRGGFPCLCGRIRTRD